jgi:glycosyltransferase involved in cell wall biosynthesis
MMKVLIATPAYTGEVNVKYTISLINTIRISISRNIHIDLAYTTSDALVQKSRNYLVTLAINENYDYIIFIDDDIEWDPEWIFQMIKFQVDVVCGVYRKKYDEPEQYAVRLIEPLQGDSRTGLLKADGVNTGFLCLTRKACISLWAVSEPYDSGILPNERMMFDIKIENGTLFSEDYVMSHKLKSLGYELWVDPRMTCVHYGPKGFSGHFIKWLEDSGRFQK